MSVQSLQEFKMTHLAKRSTFNYHFWQLYFCHTCSSICIIYTNITEDKQAVCVRGSEREYINII